MRRAPATALWVGVLLAAFLTAGGTGAQAPEQMPRQQLPRVQPPLDGGTRQLIDLRRRLIELDRLLALKSLGRAESVLQDLEQHRALAGELVPRRIRLAQLKEDHRQAVDLCRAALPGQPLNPALWRALASSLLAIDQPDSARQALDMFIGASPNARSAGMVAVELLQMADRPRTTVALIDSLRITLGEARFLGRQRAASLLTLGDQTAAADEVTAELRLNPFNLGLIRTELLEGPYRPGAAQTFLGRLASNAAAPDGRPAEALLAANLHLAGGDAASALALVLPRLASRSAVMDVLQNAAALSQELDTAFAPGQLQAMVDYLLAVLEKMMGPTNPDPGLRYRAADYLALVCEKGLEARALGDDLQQAVRRYGDLFAEVRRVNPSSQYLYSGQIKLAAYTRDVLRQPGQAAGQLERMLLDLDLPTEGVALVRLTLGECYLAAADTARGRTVLTQLGRDPEFREAAGHAHYHLARLDLAEGHFATARDRFAVVAMDNPSAPYANDALDLGLAIAEEMDNPSGGPTILKVYARAVYHVLTGQPDQRIAALEDFVAEAVLRLDPQDKQHLLERGRFELAQALLEAGRREEGLARLAEIVRDHPDGRYPGQALLLRARSLQRLGRHEEARRDLEQLLAQYPDYLFLDDARDELRNLP